MRGPGIGQQRNLPRIFVRWCAHAGCSDVSNEVLILGYGAPTSYLMAFEPFDGFPVTKKLTGSKRQRRWQCIILYLPRHVLLAPAAAGLRTAKFSYWDLLAPMFGYQLAGVRRAPPVLSVVAVRLHRLDSELLPAADSPFGAPNGGDCGNKRATGNLPDRGCDPWN